MGVRKFSKLRLPQLWRLITLCEDLRLRWGLKQSCNHCRELSNDMWHATCTQGNRGNYWLLMVGSQIGILTPDLSFGHNLCFKNSNGSCEPILDIYVPSFQWCKELFNSMSFDPCNRPLEIRESIGTLILKVRVHSLTLSYTPVIMKCDSQAHSWPTPLQALALVTSPRLGLQQFFLAIVKKIRLISWWKNMTKWSSYHVMLYLKRWIIKSPLLMILKILFLIPIFLNHIPIIV